jgi:hypothetical protein
MGSVSLLYRFTRLVSWGFVITLLFSSGCEVFGLEDEVPSEVITPKPAQLHTLNLSAEGFTQTINNVEHVYPKANIYFYKAGWNTSSLLAEIGNFPQSPYRIDYALTIDLDSIITIETARYGIQFPFKNIASYHYAIGCLITSGHIALYKPDGLLGNSFEPNYYDGKLKVDTFYFAPGAATTFWSSSYFAERPINTFYRDSSFAPEDIISCTTFCYVWTLEYIAFWLKNSQSNTCKAITANGTTINIPKDFIISQLLEQFNQQPITAIQLSGSTSLNIFNFSGMVFPDDMPESLGTKPGYPLTLRIPKPG